MFIILCIMFLLIILLTFYILLEDHVNKHSIAIQEIKKINQKYHFHQLDEYILINKYDNEHSYDDITPKDYLTYQLVYIQKDVKEQMRKTLENNNQFNFYFSEIKELLSINGFDVPTPKIIQFLTRKMIVRKLSKLSYKPRILFYIKVILIRTNIQDRYLERKIGMFSHEEVEVIIERLKNKRNDRYNDQEIWDSICKVERGKVSNKMRFSIYNRDGNRCRMCGRRTNDLEIDHIMPISKGGKSTYDNLQTLCHDCNVRKSNIVGHVYNTKDELICPKCGAPLKLKYGKYGKFYGCINYPVCNYIKK